MVQIKVGRFSRLLLIIVLHWKWNNVNLYIIWYSLGVSCNWWQLKMFLYSHNVKVNIKLQIIIIPDHLNHSRDYIDHLWMTKGKLFCYCISTSPCTINSCLSFKNKNKKKTSKQNLLKIRWIIDRVLCFSFTFRCRWVIGSVGGNIFLLTFLYTNLLNK